MVVSSQESPGFELAMKIGKKTYRMFAIKNSILVNYCIRTKCCSFLKPNTSQQI